MKGNDLHQIENPLGVESACSITDKPLGGGQRCNDN